MVEYRTIGEILLVITLMASLGVVVTTDTASNNIYTCEATKIDMYCFKLSSLSNGIQRNCYFNENKATSYKTCITGWNKISVEQIVEDPIEIPIEKILVEKVDKNVVGTIKYVCNIDNCFKI